MTRLGDLRGVRVLAIDDEEDALALLRVVLEAAGATVTTTRLGGAGARAARDGRTRMCWSWISGCPTWMDSSSSLASARRRMPAVRDIPAAALTAFARSEDRTRALESGFEMHLAKPVDPGELVASLVTLVRRSRRNGARPATEPGD